MGEHIPAPPPWPRPGEWEVTEEHATRGAIILGGSKSRYLETDADIALNHPAHWNGGGYPNGKQGEAIPVAAGITHRCDICDAFRSKRTCKLAFGHRMALDIITRGGACSQPEQFDSAIFEAFTQMHQVFRDMFVEHTTWEDLRRLGARLISEATLRPH